MMSNVHHSELGSVISDCLLPGVRGATGSQGRLGFTGQQGPRGNDGGKGNDGVTGGTGTTGRQGKTGGTGMWLLLDEHMLLKNKQTYFR